MNDHLLDAESNRSLISDDAPGQSVPAWLYRRALYLLNQELYLNTGALQRIVADLLTQTGMQIPHELMLVIRESFWGMIGDFRRNRIYNFTEDQMAPGEHDLQIRPVPNIRDDAINPAETAEVRQAASILTGQTPPRQSSPLDDVEQVNRRNLTIPTSNERGEPVPNEIVIDANEARRQRYAGRPVLLGLERPARPSLAVDHDSQAGFRSILREINAEQDIGSALEGDHVQPTDAYLTGTAELPLVQDERGLINHATPEELQRRAPFHAPDHPPSPRPTRNNYDFARDDPDLHYYSGSDGLQGVNGAMRPFRRSPNQPAAPKGKSQGSKARGTAKNKAKSQTTTGGNAAQDAPVAPTRQRAAPRSRAAPTTDRETRAGVAKRKRDEEAEATADNDNDKGDDAPSDSGKNQDKDNAPPAKKRQNAKGKAAATDKNADTTNDQSSDVTQSGKTVPPKKAGNKRKRAAEATEDTNHTDSQQQPEESGGATQPAPKNKRARSKRPHEETTTIDHDQTVTTTTDNQDGSDAPIAKKPRITIKLRSTTGSATNTPEKDTDTSTNGTNAPATPRTLILHGPLPPFGVTTPRTTTRFTLRSQRGLATAPDPASTATDAAATTTAKPRKSRKRAREDEEEVKKSDEKDPEDEGKDKKKGKDGKEKKKPGPKRRRKP